MNSLALLQFLWLLEVPRILKHPGNNTDVYSTHTHTVIFIHMCECFNTHWCNSVSHKSL